MKQDIIKRKVVIVTGGSNGIGEAIVRFLAKDNYDVILNYNNSEQKAEQIKKEIYKKYNRNIHIFKSDVSKREEVKQLIKYCIDVFGKIDVLINNAGISQVKLFTEITDFDWDNMLQVNLTSAFYMTQESLKYMLQEKNGCIINISSIWGTTGASCEVHYSVAKAGLDGMTKALAKELGPSNIRVNSIAPGLIDTRMNSELSTEEMKKITEEIPLEKIGKTLDIARCIKWIIEDEYTTGQVIGINGGWNI